ncbi:hypothetical protein FOF52_01200 [Thermobifida alba]|uniref:Uncharacterized protein n=1 Tax=Thermobifida alba TaxID=53522 RepID=A0ABY4KWE0_THEAE|nr:hypothetical protein [Thermobifida alba]UPT19751.1 hypothetical protein FOF52_01200 [Thermobifida alba]
MSAQVMTGDTRQSLLARLQEEVHRMGGTALIALSATAHPVLYVRASTRLVPVVVVEDAPGNRWFIWGRTGSAHVTRVKEAAAALCGRERPPTRSRINLVAARRASLKGAA